MIWDIGSSEVPFWTHKCYIGVFRYPTIHFLGQCTIDLYIWVCRFVRKWGIAPIFSHFFSQGKTALRLIFWFSHNCHVPKTSFVCSKHGSRFLWSCHRTLAITVLPALSRCPDWIGGPQLSHQMRLTFFRPNLLK